MSQTKFDWFVPETCEAEPVHAACYTPGPWVFGDGGFDGDVPYLNIYAQQQGGPIIASVLSEEVGLDAAKHNAAIVAAAPELLEACRLAIDVIGDRLCTNKIQAAIDKATKGR